MQIAWIYERPVDLDTVRRFHDNIGYGLAGRRVERSPLPFGRQRWVTVLGPQAPLYVEPVSWDRAMLGEWLDKRSQVPVDPEHGPGWHLAVLPMTDGATAMTLVASHNLGDGVAGLLSVFEAVAGSQRRLGYPPPKSRGVLRAAADDCRDAVRSLPEVGRLAVRTAKMLRQARQESTGQTPVQAVPAGRGCDCQVLVPCIAVLIDADEWDSRAAALGGTSYSLLAGFAARIGARMGRARDGAVSLSIALNERTGLDDTRAIALSFAKVTVDARRVTDDLSGARVAIREALADARQAPDESLDLLPLVPWVPKRLLAHFAGEFHGSGGDLDVYCSNLGDVDGVVSRAAGTESDYVIFRGVDQNVRRRDIEQAGGQLVVVAGRINGKVSISISAYEVGVDNTRSRLREIITRAMADFDVSGVLV
ncbi:hypothetical protein ACQI4F_07170 [Mycolicibacterium vaccae]|uniref:hypothetical protein n=1 Tax=Mycolicibacterium vaccae TaxID=1810 RepID=UPI003CF70FB5